MPADGGVYLEATEYTVGYVTSIPIEKLYTFVLTEEVLEEYASIIDGCRRRYIDRHFKSLEVLKELEKSEL